MLLNRAASAAASLGDRGQECPVYLVFIVAQSGALIVDGCWGRKEASVLTVKLLPCFWFL